MTYHYYLKYHSYLSSCFFTRNSSSSVVPVLSRLLMPIIQNHCYFRSLTTVLMDRPDWYHVHVLIIFTFCCNISNMASYIVFITFATLNPLPPPSIYGKLVLTFVNVDMLPGCLVLLQIFQKVGVVSKQLLNNIQFYAEWLLKSKKLKNCTYICMLFF